VAHDEVLPKMTENGAVSRGGPLEVKIDDSERLELRPFESPTHLFPTLEGSGTLEASPLPVRTTEEAVRPSIRVLRGILKKPRRLSKVGSVGLGPVRPVEQKVIQPPSIENNAVPTPSHDTGESSPLCEDEENPATESLPPMPKPENVDKRLGPMPGTIPKAALQMPSFDRMLFAIRGAQLRDEYMKQSAADPNIGDVGGL